MIEPEPRGTVGDRVARLWACGDLAELFRGDGMAAVPWSRAGRRKHEPPPGQRAVVELLRHRPRLVDIDPRHLHANQGFVLAHHAAYYLTGVWERTGVTAADMDQVANRYPIIAVTERGKWVIRTGHHRSLAALVQGRALRARVAGLDIDPGDAVAVTPRLLVGTSTIVRAEKTADAVTAADVVGRDQTALVADSATAGEVLAGGFGLDEDDVADRLKVACLSVATDRSEGVANYPAGCGGSTGGQ